MGCGPRAGYGCFFSRLSFRFSFSVSFGFDGDGPDVFERTKIIGYTSWIPNEPVVSRKGVDPQVRHVMARAIAL